MTLPRPLLAQNAYNQLASEGQMIVNAVNQYRTQSGVTSLSVNPYLNATAQAHANDLATNAYFSHIARDGSNVLQRTQRSGYNGVFVGENLAGAADAAMAMQLWIDSSGHRTNMLNGEYAEIGVGVAYDATHRWTVYVTVFGKAATAVVAAAEINVGVTAVPPAPDLVQLPVVQVQVVQATNNNATVCTGQYTVRPGDTLASVARLYKTTWQALAQFNQLAQPNHLQIGQQLCVS